MRFYITIQGSTIKKEGDRFLVKKQNDIYHTIFINKLQQLYLFGNINLTSPVVKTILKENIDTIFFTKDGRYVGRFCINESKNFFLRKKQFYLSDDNNFILEMSKSIVKAKLFSMVSLLMRIARTKNKKICKKLAEEVKELIKKVDDADSVDSVRGYEGKGSSIYFSGISNGFIEDFGFRKRVRRPPTDPVNSVLSLLYTFLFNRIYASIRAANLDPYPGNLHTPDYGRYALVMDLMEEFRIIVVDTLCLSLFNLGILKKQDFIQVQRTCYENEDGETEYKYELEDNIIKDKFGLMNKVEKSEFFDVPEQRFSEDSIDLSIDDKGKLPVQLTKDALKKVIAAFEKKLQTEFYYEPLQRRISYEKAMFEQARLYRKVVEGEIKTYTPLVLK